MASLNRVVLIGNLTRDPELRFTPSGTSVANFGIAINRRRTNRQGERVDGVDYFNVVVWGRLAELCNEYIGKGAPVAIEGRLQSRSWETQDGQKRSTVEVVAENVQFLGRLGGREGSVVSEEMPEDISPAVGGEEAVKKGAPEEGVDEDIPF
ncbi:MAG: single-stranded DNA-binding protein [Actinomycetota bacterium]|nr:single-stranded DNA-binding protein [Actinomycetota bacterium]